MSNTDFFNRSMDTTGMAYPRFPSRERREATASGPVLTNARANAKEVDLGQQEVAQFPTWSGWGTTNVRATNTGPVVVTVALYAGAGFEERELSPSGQHGDSFLFSRQWAGFTVYVKNSSEDPAATLHLEVW